MGLGLRKDWAGWLLSSEPPSHSRSKQSGQFRITMTPNHSFLVMISLISAASLLSDFLNDARDLISTDLEGSSGRICFGIHVVEVSLVVDPDPTGSDSKESLSASISLHLSFQT